ncbi:AraC family transcriptional regulator [Chitinophaga qingshengii]|uniref:Helix-turn-helix domain-containing protein n=1 Tax=Chitinophaga qingshengii TaxID=1569794 RepID=A0ABR7TP89_9BACT|nr:AraC family transcriptional regulator [Chitinophaga qingshengii]MBC9931803.1 helix-turn-helix domain-containing protein [Chitinophaga qingshengii]
MYNHASSIPTYSLEQSGGRNNLFDIRLADGTYREHPSIFLTPHRKDFYMLVLVETGSSRHWVDMQPYTLKPDTFYFTAPHQVHVKEEAEPMQGIVLCFTDVFLSTALQQQLKQLPVLQNPDNGHELLLTREDTEYLRDTMLRMVHEHQLRPDWHNTMLQAYLHVLLIYLSRLYTEQFTVPNRQPDRVLLKKFLHLLEVNYTRHHEVAAYAGLLNITAGHLGDVIKAQSGKSAIEHIHARVLLEARRLLFYTDHSIKEIAFALGFEDASYFNRFFKRGYQQTPLAFRTASRKMYH